MGNDAMWIDSNARDFGSNADAQPANTSLASLMNVELMINERGNIWVLHDKPLPMVLNWVEYDAGMSSLSFVSQDGQVVDLGMKIHAPMKKAFVGAREIYVVFMAGKDIKDMYVLPLMARTQ